MVYMIFIRVLYNRYMTSICGLYALCTISTCTLDFVIYGLHGLHTSIYEIYTSIIWPLYLGCFFYNLYKISSYPVCMILYLLHMTFVQSPYDVHMLYTTRICGLYNLHTFSIWAWHGLYLSFLRGLHELHTITAWTLYMTAIRTLSEA